jgi:hypothetical protein
MTLFRAAPISADPTSEDAFADPYFRSRASISIQRKSRTELSLGEARSDSGCIGTNALQRRNASGVRIQLLTLWGLSLVYAGSAMLLERQKASRIGRMPVTAASLCPKQQIVS